MNRMGMRFFSSDHYAEETTRQIPSNTPFLVAQNSPTSKVYRWKTQIVTDLSTAPCKSKKFGASGEWCIKIGLVDKKFSVRLILDNRSEYLHFYLGVIVPSGQLYSASSFDDNWNLPSAYSVGFHDLFEKNDIQYGFDGSFDIDNYMTTIGSVIVLEIGIETWPGKRADPDYKPVRPAKRDMSSKLCLTTDDLGYKTMLPQDIFFCVVCQDLCDISDALLCAAGEHVLCREHFINDEYKNLCGCCRTSMNNAKPIPHILHRLYRSLEGVAHMSRIAGLDHVVGVTGETQISAVNKKHRLDLEEDEEEGQPPQKRSNE